MTNNTTFNASIIIEAQNALQAAKDALKAARAQARDFMVDYVKSKNGEVVSVKELSKITGLKPITVGMFLSRDNRVWSSTYVTNEKYVKLDENGNPIMSEVKFISTRSAGYCKPGNLNW